MGSFLGAVRSSRKLTIAAFSSASVNMSSTRVNRVTLFKIPDKENQKKMLAAYDVLAKDQSKV